MLYLKLIPEQAPKLIATGMFQPVAKMKDGKATFCLEPTPLANDGGEPVAFRLMTARNKIRVFSDLNRLAAMLADIGIETFTIDIKEDTK